MKNELKIFIPFFKVDKKKKMVFGYISTEMEDSQGEIVDKNAIREAWEDYMKFANIREMHQPSAVGVTKEFMHDKKGTWIGAKIVDKEAWEKVLEEVYKGFSIGGMVVKKIGKKIKELILNEISIVDRPANPEAVFTMIKRSKNGLIEINKSQALLGEGQKVESLIKIVDNFMSEENKIEKARRKKKDTKETGKEEEKKKETKASEDQTIPPEEKKEKEESKEESKEEGKDTVDNKEFGTTPREQSTVPNIEKKESEEREGEESGEEKEESEEGKEGEEGAEEKEEIAEGTEESEETEGTEEKKDEGESEESSESEEKEEGKEEGESIEKDVSEVVVLSEVAGHLKWLKSAFENNKRPKEVIKYVEKALENVMAAIRVEAKRENTGKTEKIENFNDLGELLEQKLGEISEQVKSSGLAKAKEIIEEVSSLKERLKTLEDKPAGQRPKTVFTIEKGEGSDEPKNILTIKKEMKEITEEISKVHSEGLTLVGGVNPQKEQEVKGKLEELGKKLAKKKRELNEAVYP